MNVKEFVKTYLPDRILIHRLKKNGSGSVLLTFDDGPSPEYTPVVLDILKENGARAVFFVVGSKAESCPSLIRRIKKEGHVLGNHSFRHYQERMLSCWAYREDVLKCQRTITEISGEYPSFFRPPGGVISAASIATSLLSRMTIMLWSVEAYEWTKNKKSDVDLISRQIIADLKGGDIVLLHDDNPKIPYVLNAALRYLKCHDFDLQNWIHYT